MPITNKVVFSITLSPHFLLNGIPAFAEVKKCCLPSEGEENRGEQYKYTMLWPSLGCAGLTEDITKKKINARIFVVNILYSLGGPIIMLNGGRNANFCYYANTVVKISCKWCCFAMGFRMSKIK